MKMTIPEIEHQISQIKEEIEMTESYDTRRTLKKDLQNLTNEREAALLSPLSQCFRALREGSPWDPSAYERNGMRRIVGIKQTIEKA